MKGLYLRLKLPLGTCNSLVHTCLLGKLLIGIREFLLCSSPRTISLFQKSASLFKCILHTMCLSFRCDKLISADFLVSLFIFKATLSFPDLLMIPLDALLSFLVCSIGMFKGHFQFNNISFKLLLHSDSFSFALGFLRSQWSIFILKKSFMFLNKIRKIKIKKELHTSLKGHIISNNSNN